MNGGDRRDDGFPHDGVPNDGMRGDGRHGDYLWDRSGPVDDGIARLERLLAPFAHDASAPRTARTAHAVPRRARRPRKRWQVAVAAAAVLALCAVGMQTWYRQRLLWDAGRPWQVVSQAGDVRIDGRPAAGHASALPLQGVLQTAPGGTARLRAARIGEIALGAGSRLQLVETRTGRHRVQLLEGRLWARVWAPPGQFGVGLHGADVLDLGCEFEVETDAHGSGRLTVRSGWVQVDNGWDEVLVPQGATVRLRSDGPPGTPRDLGASAAFVAALESIDARQGRVAPDDRDVQRLVAAARPSDAITLLTLLRRHPQLADGPLFDRTAQLFPDAAAVTRNDVRLRGADALWPWWEALPYPRIKRWWMQWPDALPAGARAERWLKQPASDR